MSLVLNLPELSSQKLMVETDPKALKAWLVSLPPSNVLETGRQIHDALSSLNRCKLGDEERLQLLEHYQVAIDLLEASLDVFMAAPSLPVKDKAKQAGQLARSLQQELAHGYKWVLHERLDKRFSFGSRQIPLLLQKVLQSYQKLNWVCCRAYQAVPAGVWLEIHALFRYAIQHKLLDEPQGGSVTPSIGLLYKQILLLALADPYRYSPADLEKIHDLVGNYGAAAQFQPLGSTPNPAGFFLVRLDADLPPQFLGQRPLDIEPRNAILLDTIELAKHLHKALASVEPKIASASDKAKVLAWSELLRRVIKQWSIAPKRVFQRIRAHARVAVVGGLRATAWQVNGGKPLLQPQALDAPLTVAGDDDAASAPTNDYPLDYWTVINESPGGYAIHAMPPLHCQFRIGDVLALQNPDQNGWMIGAVRWLQQVDGDAAVELGLQVLAPKADAGMMRPTIIHAEASFQPILLLPEVPVLKQAAQILAARGAYSPQREYSICLFDGERVIRAGRLIEQTANFDLFEYTAS